MKKSEAGNWLFFIIPLLFYVIGPIPMLAVAFWLSCHEAHHANKHKS